MTWIIKLEFGLLSNCVVLFFIFIFICKCFPRALIWGMYFWKTFMLSQAVEGILIKHKSLLLVCICISCVDKDLCVSKQVQKKHHKVVRLVHLALSERCYSTTSSGVSCNSLISSSKLFTDCRGHQGWRAIAVAKGQQLKTAGQQFRNNRKQMSC